MLRTAVGCFFPETVPLKIKSCIYRDFPFPSCEQLDYMRGQGPLCRCNVIAYVDLPHKNERVVFQPQKRRCFA